MAEEQTFTTLEAEFVAGYVFGFVVEQMGGHIKEEGMTEEQERALWAVTHEAFEYLNKKTSLQLEMEADLKELTGEQ